MPQHSELFRQVRDTVLRHVYERQVVAGKWGVDFFWARKDIARMLSRPGYGTRALSDTPATVRARRFDWGFEVTFEHVIEQLAEEDLLEVRMTSALAAGRGNTLRIRDYKLTPAGIELCESRYGPALPGEARETSGATADSSDEAATDIPDAEPASDSGAAVQLPDLPDKPGNANSSEETAEFDMELAMRAAAASNGTNGTTGTTTTVDTNGSDNPPADDDPHGINAETKQISDVDVIEMPGTRKLTDPAALAANDAAASGRRSGSRRDSPSGRHPAVS